MDQIAAVVFDMDGTLVETEHLWSRARQELAAASGVAWSPDHHVAMMGMSSPEWTRYMHQEMGIPASPDAIRDHIVGWLQAHYAAEPPFLPGATAAVRRMASAFPCAIASSSNRELILALVEAGDLGDAVPVVVASEEVARGKPHGDVFVEAARRLGADPARCVAIEDSTAGLRAGLDAGMRVVTIPNRDYPPDPTVVARTHLVVSSIAGLTPDLLRDALAAS